MSSTLPPFPPFLTAAILSQLDSRLSRLDKSVAPLGIRQLSYTSKNLDAVLETLAPGSTAARPQPSRQESYNSAALASVHSSINDAPPPPSATAQSRADKRRKHGSIMDRGRAVSRPDNVPRWQEADEASIAPSVEATPPQPQWDSGISSGTDRGVLQRTPDLSSLSEYLGALQGVIQELEDMNRALLEGRGGDRAAGVESLGNLVEEAYGKLVELLLRKTREGLPRPFNPASLAGSTVPQPLTWLPEFPRIRHLSAPLSNMVYPDEPTPKTTGLLAPIFDDCIADLGGIRGEWFRQSLAPAAARVDEDSGSWDAAQGGEKVRAVMNLWEGFLTAGEVSFTLMFSADDQAEVALQSQLMPGASGEMLVGKVLSYATQTLQSVMNNVTASIKRDLTGQTMLLLDMYANLTDFQAKLDSRLGQVLGTREAEEVRDVLPNAMAVLKQLAQRSFPERLVDIRNPSRNNVANVGVDPTTHNTLSYIEVLPKFGNVVEGLLRSGRGERSWLMGLPPPSTAKSADEEGGVLNLYVADILGALIQHLEQKAAPMRKLANYTYLLNNRELHYSVCANSQCRTSGIRRRRSTRTLSACRPRT